jgi:hypothetical protein
MTALDFPDAPTQGQVFDRWTYDGTKWMLAAVGSSEPLLFFSANGATTDNNLAAAEVIPGLTTGTPLSFKKGRKYLITANWAASNRSADTAPVIQTFGLRLDSTEVTAKSVTANAPGSWLHIVTLEHVYIPAQDEKKVVSAYSQTPSYYVGSFGRVGKLIVQEIPETEGGGGATPPFYWSKYEEAFYTKADGTYSGTGHKEFIFNDTANCPVASVARITVVGYTAVRALGVHPGLQVYSNNAVNPWGAYGFVYCVNAAFNASAADNNAHEGAGIPMVLPPATCVQTIAPGAQFEWRVRLMHGDTGPILWTGGYKVLMERVPLP